MKKGLMGFFLLLLCSFILIGCEEEKVSEDTSVEDKIEINEKVEDKGSSVDNKVVETKNDLEIKDNDTNEDDFVYRITTTPIKNKKPYGEEGKYWYGEGESNLDNEYMMDAIDYIISKYQAEFDLPIEFFDGLTFDIIKGKIFSYEKDENGEKEKIDVYGTYFYGSESNIYLSSDRNKEEFFNTLQHELGHYFDYKMMEIGEINSYLYNRGHTDQLIKFKDFASDEKHEAGYENYLKEGREKFARDFSTLFSLPKELGGSGSDFFDKKYDMDDKKKKELKERIKNRIQDIQRIKEGVTISIEDTKIINGFTYIPYFELFYSLNYMLDSDGDTDNVKLVRNERKYSGKDYFYEFIPDTNTVVIDGTPIFSKDEYPIMVDGYVLLNIFGIKGADIRYKETDGGIRFWRESYSDINI